MGAQRGNPVEHTRCRTPRQLVSLARPPKRGPLAGHPGTLHANKYCDLKGTRAHTLLSSSQHMQESHSTEFWPLAASHAILISAMAEGDARFDPWVRVP